MNEFKIKNGIVIDGGQPIDNIATDTTLSASLDTNLVTEHAIKTYTTDQIDALDIGQYTTTASFDTHTSDATIHYPISSIDGLAPAGGVTSQVLTKLDNSDYSYYWSEAGGGSTSGGIPDAPDADTYLRTSGAWVQSDQFDTTKYYQNVEVDNLLNDKENYLGTQTVDGQILASSGADTRYWIDANTINGDVVGPTSAINDNIAVFVGTTGKLIKDGGNSLSQINSDINSVAGDLNTHVIDYNNPHQVDNVDVGLGNVDNTSDINKPISTATQISLDLKADLTALDDYATSADLNIHIINTNNPHVVDKIDVGLGNVDNTSDINKPSSTATQTALDAKEDSLTYGTDGQILTTNPTVDGYIWTDKTLPGGQVNSVVAGTNVSINSTDPVNPIVSSTDTTYTDLDIKTKYESNSNTNAFTDSNQTKLDGLESSKFIGQYITLPALELANPTPTIGEYGYVNEVGVDIKSYIWDNNDSIWVDSTPSIITSHNILSGRSDTDAHPISSVTGLQSSLDLKSDKSNVLELDNIVVFTPSTDYNPSTKKYVDDAILSVPTAPVDSVFGRTGIVVSTASDYDAVQVDYNNISSGLVSTDVQGAIDEVDSNVDLHISDASIHYATSAISHTTIQDIGINTHSQIDTHVGNVTTNPHVVTKTNVGLGNVDNTSDLNKPVSTATQTSLDLKTDDTDFTNHTGDTSIHFSDATSDGNVYGRKDASWSVVDTITDQERLDLGRAHKCGGFQPGSPDNTMSIDDVSRTLTITPTVTTFEFWSGDTQYNSTEKSVVVPNISGRYYVWFDGSGTLQVSGVWNVDYIIKYALASILYWNATQQLFVKFDDERHYYTRNKDWHVWAHVTQGTMLDGDADNMFELSGINPDQDGTLDSHVEFTISDGSIKDEEIVASPAEDTLSGNIPLLYQVGDLGVNEWFIDNTTVSPIRTDGTRALYNSFDGTDWTETPVPDGSYFLVHILATTGVNKKIYAVQATGAYTTILNAKSGADKEIKAILHNALPTVELVAIRSIVFRANVNLANSKHAILISDSQGKSSFDWRPYNINPIDHSLDEFESFDILIDTPDSKFGSAGKMVVVDPTEQTLVYEDIPSAGTGGQVDSIVPGVGISVNNTDPANPIVTAVGGVAGYYVSEYARIVLSSTVPNIDYIPTPYTCQFNTVDVNSNSGSYEYDSTNGIKVLRDGRYRINSQTSIKTSSESRADPRMSIYKNGVQIVSSTGKILGTSEHYARYNSGIDYSTASVDILVDLVTGDVITTVLSQGGNTGDNNVELTADNSWLEISEVISSIVGQSLWEDVGGVIDNKDDKPANINVIGGISSGYTITGTLNGLFDGDYTNSGTVDDGFLHIVYTSVAGNRIIIDSTDNYWCIDTGTSTANPIYSTTQYTNFVAHSLLGTFTGLGGNSGSNATSIMSSGTMAGASLTVNSFVKTGNDGIVISEKVRLSWDEDVNYAGLSIVDPNDGASFVIKANGTPRMAIPVPGSGNATQMYRSTLFGGYTVGHENPNDDINISNLTLFDATYIDCDTGAANSTAKPDVGVGGSLQVVDGILVGNLQSSGERVIITPTDITKDGVSIIGTDLSTHSVTELNDVTDAGSGSIITTGERSNIGNAVKIQTRNVSSTLPTDGQVLQWNNAGTIWEPTTPVGSSTAWGDITGTISSQTDLQTALDNKEDTLTYGTNGQVMTTNATADGYEWSTPTVGILSAGVDVRDLIAEGKTLFIVNQDAEVLTGDLLLPFGKKFIFYGDKSRYGSSQIKVNNLHIKNDGAPAGLPPSVIFDCSVRVEGNFTIDSLGAQPPMFFASLYNDTATRYDLVFTSANINILEGKFNIINDLGGVQDKTNSDLTGVPVVGLYNWLDAHDQHMQSQIDGLGTDVSGKINKVPTATISNVAVFDAIGGVGDAGFKKNDLGSTVNDLWSANKIQSSLDLKKNDFTENTGFNKNLGTTAGTVSEGNHLHSGTYEPANVNIQSHISSTSNPHSVTKADVGLGNVDNTSDVNKPISTSTQTAINGLVPYTGADKTVDLNGQDLNNVGLTTNDGTVITKVGQITGSFASSGLVIKTGTGNEQMVLGFDSTKSASYIGTSNSGGGADALLLNPLGGGVGIGTDSPEATTHTKGSTIFSSGIGGQWGSVVNVVEDSTSTYPAIAFKGLTGYISAIRPNLDSFNILDLNLDGSYNSTILDIDKATGRITAPEMSISDINSGDLKTLVTKEYTDPYKPLGAVLTTNVSNGTGGWLESNLKISTTGGLTLQNKNIGGDMHLVTSGHVYLGHSVAGNDKDVLLSRDITNTSADLAVASKGYVDSVIDFVSITVPVPVDTDILPMWITDEALTLTKIMAQTSDGVVTGLTVHGTTINATTTVSSTTPGITNVPPNGVVTYSATSTSSITTTGTVTITVYYKKA